jgi:hypothetical protein
MASQPTKLVQSAMPKIAERGEAERRVKPAPDMREACDPEHRCAPTLRTKISATLACLSAAITLGSSAQAQENGDVVNFVSSKGYCLDVQGASTTNGARVILWPCHTGDNQRWYLEEVPQGSFVDGIYFLVRSVHSGKCLDVRGASTQDGADVIQWDCHYGPNQLWQFRKLFWNEPEDTLVSKGSERCLDIRDRRDASGTALQQWECHDGENQLFYRFD